MASSDVHCGTGCTIEFPGSYDAQLLSIDWSGMSRGSIPTTHMDTTAATGTTQFGSMTFIPSTHSDPGEISVEFHLNPDTTLNIIDADTATVTVEFPEGATWAVKAFATGFETHEPLEDKMTGSVTLKATGVAVITAAVE